MEGMVFLDVLGVLGVTLYRFFSLTTNRTLEPSVPTILYTSHCEHGALLAYNFILRTLEPSVSTFVCVVC